MNKSYEELKREIAELNIRAEEARKQELVAAKEQIFSIMTKYSISLNELGKSGKVAGSKPKSQVEPVYRDPTSGKTWTGRGRAPRWLDGKDRNDFKIIR